LIKQKKPVVLSKRLGVIAEMLSPGGRVVDVGCDHGFLDIYLVQTGKVAGALAMDVRKGPLSAASEHVREAGFEGVIETRLSDGLEAYHLREGDKLVCAGMGGKLMQRILTAYPEKTADFGEMILQPQSELREFRAFLRDNGFQVTEERAILEDGKFYFPMKVVRGDKGISLECSDRDLEVYDRYGEKLIQSKDPVLLQFLIGQERILGGVREGLIGNASQLSEDGKNRLLEVENEWEILQRAISLVK
jgi:tRNA (adenine22-N1)-methyltransferase